MTKIALVFPGQGSQKVGMLAELASQHPIVEKIFAQASEVLTYDLWQLVQQGPEERLDQTQYAQPALLAAGAAVFWIWQQNGGPKAAMLAGHSLGEYTALVCAESIDFQDAVKLVAERGRIMQEAVPRGTGAMLAIVGLDEDKVLEISKAAAQGKVLTPANYNAIGQIVLAGEAEAAQRALDLAKQAGAKMAKLLPVTIPSHCELMRDAAMHFNEVLQDVVVRTPKIPVIQNADVKFYNDPELIRDALIRQLYNPVRWIETIKFMVQSGITHVFESGPGKVLTGLNRRIVKNLVVNYLGMPQNLQESLKLF